MVLNKTRLRKHIGVQFENCLIIGEYKNNKKIFEIDSPPLQHIQHPPPLLMREEVPRVVPLLSQGAVYRERLDLQQRCSQVGILINLLILIQNMKY